MSNLLKGVNLYLIGMMGSGKTTIGQRLAKQLGYCFFDTDAVIQQATGKSVSQLFTESGEAEFRQLETQVLAELSAYTRLTIATGGGVVLKRENWSYLHHGVIVWLDVSVEQLQQRLQGDTTRPLLQQTDSTATLQTILAQRQKLYAQADVRVVCQADDPPNEIAAQVMDQLRQVVKTEQPDTHDPLTS